MEKNFKDLTTAEIREKVLHQRELESILPPLLEMLKKDLYTGDTREGDLLNAVLEISKPFWISHPDLWRKLYEMIDGKLAELKDHDIFFDSFIHIKRDLL